MPLTEIPRRLDLAAGQYYRKADVDRKLERLVSDLREQGYYEARADHQLRPAPQAGTAELAINVDGGARITVVFEGDPLSAEGAARAGADRARGLGGRGPAGGLGQPHREHLRAQGYRDADAEYERTPRDGGLAVVFKVRRGPQFRTARVTMAGATAVPEADLRALLRTREGEPVRRGRGRVRRRHAGRAVPPPRLHAGARRAGVGARGRQRVAGAGRRAAHRDRRAADGRRRPSPSPARPPSTRRRCGRRSPRVPASPTTSSRWRSTATACCWCCSIAATRRPSSTPAWSFTPGPVVGRRRICRRRGPAGLRRARADRRQREDERRDDPPRGHAEARRAAQLRRAHREPAAHQRARAVPPRPHHRARSRRAEPARPAGHRRGGAGDHGRLRRRRRGRPAAAPGPSRAATRRRCSRSRRAGLSSTAGEISSAATSPSTCSRAPACARRASTTNVDEGEEEPSGYTLRDYRLLGTYRLPRVFGIVQRPAGHRVSSSRGCDPASTSPGAAPGRS